MRTAGSALVLSLALLAGSCRNIHRGTETSVSTRPARVVQTRPSWYDLPADTWAELDAIEAWLVSPEAEVATAWRADACWKLGNGLIRRATEAEDPDARSLRLNKGKHYLRRFLAEASLEDARRRLAETTLEAQVPVGLRTARKPAGLVPRSEWSGGMKPNPNKMTRHERAFERITVHHSATEARTTSPKGILRYHLMDKGWGDVGYHYLIDAEGTIYEGRSLTYQGAHAGNHSATGQNLNPGRIGVCLIGDYDKGPVPVRAWWALERLLGELMDIHGLDGCNVEGHKHAGASTECPGEFLGRRLEEWKRKRGCR